MVSETRAAHGREEASGPLEQAVARIAEDVRRSTELSSAFREVAADRAVRVSQLSQEVRSLQRELQASRVAAAAARRTANELKDQRARESALHQQQVAGLTKRVRASEREVARLRRSPLVRVAAKVDAGLRRVVRALRPGRRRG